MAYIGSSPTKVVSRQSANIFTYTATANQTAFTGADANGNTLACTPSDIMVHMNGLRLEESDYTASTTTVTLGSGAAAGDEVTITAFVTFESADHYNKSTADTRYVNTTGDTMTGNLAINNASGSQVTLHRTDTTIANDDLYGQIILSGDDADTNASGTRGYIRGRSQGTGGGLKMEFGTAGGGVAIGDPRMIINADGYVTMPNQPSFSAYRDAGDVNAGNVYIFNGTHHNIGGMYSTSTGRGTVPVTGNYHVSFWMMSRNDQTYNNKYVRLRINSASPAYKNVYTSNGGSVHHQISWAGIIRLQANDYVDIYINDYALYGANYLYSNFSMHLLS